MTCRDGFSKAECQAAAVQEKGGPNAGCQWHEKGGRGIGMTVYLPLQECDG